MRNPEEKNDSFIVHIMKVSCVELHVHACEPLPRIEFVGGRDHLSLSGYISHPAHLPVTATVSMTTLSVSSLSEGYYLLQIRPLRSVHPVGRDTEPPELYQELLDK